MFYSLASCAICYRWLFFLCGFFSEVFFCLLFIHLKNGKKSHFDRSHISDMAAILWKCSKLNGQCVCLCWCDTEKTSAKWFCACCFFSFVKWEINSHLGFENSLSRGNLQKKSTIFLSIKGYFSRCPIHLQTKILIHSNHFVWPMHCPKFHFHYSSMPCCPALSLSLALFTLHCSFLTSIFFSFHLERNISHIWFIFKIDLCT